MVSSGKLKQAAASKYWQVAVAALALALTVAMRVRARALVYGRRAWWVCMAGIRWCVCVRVLGVGGWGEGVGLGAQDARFRRW